jgi:GMP synthase-like glutamine amidotransferase
MYEHTETYDYACMNAWKCMIGLQFGREVSQRQTKHWKIGHMVARAITYTWKTSLDRSSLRNVSKPWLRAIYHIPYKLVEEGPWEIL